MPTARRVKRTLWSGLGKLGKALRLGGTPILTYHSIDDSGSLISVSPAAFSEQMEYLHRHGFRAVPLRDYVMQLPLDALPRRHAFVLTFDDGFRNVHEIALPILRRLGFVATVFVPTDYVGKPASWTMRPGLPQLPLMSWEELAELQAAGFDIQSHACSHPFLTALTPAEAAREIVESKRTIERRLGNTTDLFCFPYGDRDAAVAEILRDSGYRGAVSLEFGLNSRGDDPLCLRRLGSAHFTSPAKFEACVWGMYAPLLRARLRLRAALLGVRPDPRRTPI
jgi:peptidoglycan/xylan/chitin deacetylase (PgdA/CDA1 family)